MEIEVKNLSKVFDDAGSQLKVIDNLSWSAAGGKSIAITGKSGVGKSTLLHLLAGIEEASQGSINLFETEVTNLNNNQIADFRLANVGMIFQFNNLLPEFTALENVSLPLMLKLSNQKEIQDKAFALLEQVELADRAEHRPGELSGGEQQRVAIARALANDPKLLLADEPTGSLDSETGQKISSVLLNLVKSQGITLIAASHSKELADKFDLVYKMESGGDLYEVN